MLQTNFHPNLTSEKGGSNESDAIVTGFTRLAQNILVVAFGLLPIFFVPISYAPFSFTKTLMVIVMVVVSVIFFSFAVLRAGRINLRAPLVIIALWLVAAVSILSALFSGDISDGIIGDVVGVQTGVFICLLALSATVIGMLRGAKAAILRFYLLLILSAVILFIFHALRILFGESFASLGLFNGATSTPLGDWNDLAMFFGLIVIMAMMGLEQLSLNRVSQIVLAGLLVVSLLMLAVVNYSAIWLILGVISFIQLLYSLTQNRFSGGQKLLNDDDSSKIFSITLTALVFISSLAFTIAGGSIGAFVSSMTDVSYIEVRPSLESTLDITGLVYQDHGVLGIGTNRFVDAWRLYKDPQINETIFWNTNFDAGSGFIPTMFVTNGILGAVAWVLFFAALLYTGFRMIFAASSVDRIWYFFSTTSLVATFYLWIIALIYNPSTVMLLLTAVCTGILAVTYTEIVPQRSIILRADSNRALSVVMIGLVTLVIVGSVSGVYAVSRHYVAVLSISQTFAAVQSDSDIESLETAAVKSYQTTPNDLYARELAYYQLLQMNSMLQITEPTEEDATRFQETASTGLQAAQAAITLDPTEPKNYVILANIYNSLALAGIEGSSARVMETFDKAAEYDPKNPSIIFAKAQHAALISDVTQAREYANQAIGLKSNYTEALIFLAQIDISEGKTKDAIERVRSIINFEPNNPARYYQLGVLMISDDDLVGAKAAFSRAVALDRNYANARYYLGLVHLQEGNNELALEQLRLVSELNPDNEDLKELIKNIENGDVNVVPESGNSDVTTPSAGSDEGNVTVDSDPGTNLVTPVNAIPSEEE